MSYQITLSIDEDSVEGHNIDALTEAEHISREQAARQLLAAAFSEQPKPASPKARRILGAFREDAALMDEVLDLAMQERQRRNSALPHD